MKAFFCKSLSVISLLAAPTLAWGDVKVVTDHNDPERATPAFKFAHVPAPRKADAGGTAKLSLIDGRADGASAELSKLNDGRLPTENDQPEENFFFANGSEGGRILFDLGKVLEVKQVNSYSWHPNSRGPQAYKLFGSDGTAEGFNAKPTKESDPEKCGWKLITSVTTSQEGGQHGVSVFDSDGILGKFRYVLFAIKPSETADGFGNTFYSEIDIVENGATEEALAQAAYTPFVTNTVDGKCEFTIDTSAAPDLKEWAEQKLAPVLAVWYPKICEMLPSEGYNPPAKFSIKLAPGNGVAATGGNRVTANSAWIKRELNGEAIGALVHEAAHVVQQYRGGGGRRGGTGTNATVRPPGWLTEAIPDYIRWFKYEPQSHGADIVWMKKQRNFVPTYEEGFSRYRAGANFLNWASEKYDQKLVTKLNAAVRSRTYTEDLWKNATGKTEKELSDEWKELVLKELGKPAAVN